MGVSFLLCALQGVGYVGLGSALAGAHPAVPLLALALVVVLAFLGRNPHQSALHVATFGLLGRPDFCVDGTVAPGFEAVRRAFEENFEQGLERSSQFCVYHKGNKVVDLWGCVRGQGVRGAREGREYDGDSLQVVFSSTKVLAALAIDVLVDRGRLAYDDPVSKVWPEFGQNGKEGITVRDCLRHEGGLPFLEDDRPIELADVSDPSALAKRFEESPPQGWEDDETVHHCAEYKGTSKRSYHSSTYGYLLSLICRKADAKGRGLHGFVRDEIASPLKVTDSIYIGCLPDTLEQRVAPLGLQSFSTLVGGMCATRWGLLTGPEHVNEMGSKSLMKVLMNASKYKSAHTVKRSRHRARHIELTQEEEMPQPSDMGYLMWNLRCMHRTENGSINGMMSARAMARVAAAMSLGGAIDGVTLLSPDGWKRAHVGADKKFDVGVHQWTTFVQGGFCEFHESEGFIPEAEGFYGWGGLGGSSFSWNPQKQLGVAYAHNGPLRTSLGAGFKDPRSAALIRATLQCL